MVGPGTSATIVVNEATVVKTDIVEVEVTSVTDVTVLITTASATKSVMVAIAVLVTLLPAMGFLQSLRASKFNGRNEAVCARMVDW